MSEPIPMSTLLDRLEAVQAENRVLRSRANAPKTPSFRSEVFQAAERANKRCGQWMPQQWLEIFIGEMMVEPD
jgi:hypothetical protein